jgi:hypothetical protein
MGVKRWQGACSLQLARPALTPTKALMMAHTCRLDLDQHYDHFAVTLRLSAIFRAVETLRLAILEK